MKKWLITGASSGFGRLLTERVATNGDHVIAVARREDRLRKLAANHDSVTALVVDLTAPDVEQRLECVDSHRRRPALPALGCRLGAGDDRLQGCDVSLEGASPLFGECDTDSSTVI